jgi:protein Mpv17
MTNNRINTCRPLLLSIAALLLLVSNNVPTVTGFGVIGVVVDPSALHEVITATTSQIMPSAQSFLQDRTDTLLASNTDLNLNLNVNLNLLDAYKESLASHPLTTKMLTGGTLAVCGDAIAQSRTPEPYDQRRAASFAAFDGVYRAVQHFSFPAIVQHCQGQYMGALSAALSLPFASMSMSMSANSNLEFDVSQFNFGAVEQTLVSQLGIVPFFYYPVFYTVTAFVQGLDREAAVQRAKDTFVPLMKRNLLFWIPIQFVQFGYVDESLQIPFLSVAGLVWTFIISVFAGNANANANANQVVSEEEAELVVEMRQDVITNSDRMALQKQILRTVTKEESEQLVEEEEVQLVVEEEKVLLLRR